MNKTRKPDRPDCKQVNQSPKDKQFRPEKSPDKYKTKGL